MCLSHLIYTMRPCLIHTCHALTMLFFSMPWHSTAVSLDLHSAAVSDSHLPCHALTMLFFSRPQHSVTVSRRLCCAVALRRLAWAWHGKCESDKGKGKVTSRGLFNTPAARPYCILTPTSSRIHLQRRHASYRCARPLPAKVGTITNEFC
jgi:hypothetical protein